jgi:hypothetical protein
MAGTTPNLALYLPGGGSTGVHTPDEVADIDPLNQNFQKIDTFAGSVGNLSTQNKQYTGPATAIGTVTGQKLGDEYQESDSNKFLWRYDGSNWVLFQAGSALIRPGSVGGTGTSLVNGVVALSSASGDVSVLDCFSTKYNHYILDIDIANSNGASSLSLVFRTAGGPITEGYGLVYLETTLTGGPVRAASASAVNLNAGSYGTAGGGIQVDVYSPSSVKSPKVVAVKSMASDGAHRIGGGTIPGTAAVTGFTFNLPAATNGFIHVLGVGGP